MKNNIVLLLVLVCLSGLFTPKAQAQLATYNSAKERIYIHTNHVFFKPGDDLFFKLYLVQAAELYPSFTSKVVYVEILSPAGTVLKKQQYRIEDGSMEGHYQIDAQANGGIYRVRAYTAWMKNEKESTWFTKEITVQRVIAPRILMKLDFPAKGYGAGDEVIASYSMRNLADQPIRLHSINYSVQLGGQQVQSAAMQTDSAGKATVRFRLPATLNTSDGLLNVSVKYDGYVEAISRSIPIVLNKIDLQFLPEGGTLVAGLPATMAFIAVNEYGKPVDVKGTIVNGRGKTVAEFTSYHDGMGAFPFTPVAGEGYHAVISRPAGVAGRFVVPAATAKGVVMQLAQQDKLVKLHIASTVQQQVRLTATSKNKGYFEKELRLKAGEQWVEVNTDDFPAGIARFTLTDALQRPLAERIAFLHRNRVLHISMTTDKASYLPREKVTLHISTRDEQQKPVASNLSLAVLDDKLWTLADDKQDHILSWLLLSSELKGRIEEPQFYFKKETLKEAAALDLLMLTHGYRYFDYTDEVMRDGKPQYQPELSNMLSGVILNEKQEPALATVYLVAMPYNRHDTGRVIKQQTGSDGRFFFESLLPGMRYQLVARSVRKKTLISIRIEQQGAGTRPAMVRTTIVPEVNGTPAVVLPKAKEEAVLWEQKQLAGRLDEVVVTGYGVAGKKDVIGSVTTIRQAQLLQVANIADALQGRIAGLYVTPYGASTVAGNQINIRGGANVSGNATPLFVVDGVPVEKIDLTINPGFIENITVYKDAAATAIYGSRAVNGVVAITTKSNLYSSTKISFNRQLYYASLEVTGRDISYEAPRRFYAPQYASAETRVRDDFRETIYWNPVVQTDNKGEASVSFYNSDATTTFRAIAEGIGYNGRAGHGEATYAASSPLSIDAKIPPYVTVGDEVKIPLVIKNQGKTALSAIVHIQLPDGLEAGSYEHRIAIEAESAREVLLPVTVRAAVNGNIRFSVKTELGTEQISLPVITGHKGFPVVVSLSGNTNVAANFKLSKSMSGSIAASLQVYKDVEGHLLNGIESMLREPYGCFEQTSSTTYPNLFILKYLRATGKTNKAIEEKAMQYIRKGYERLIGFETAENGFEWFGHTPAHEALTAYGLLEFTDMQAFIPVNPRMLERTRQFLMSRRDGKGGFTLRSGGYDKFASVPGNIANVYIVYALTQAGIGKDIEPEYRAAVAAALKSGDAYQLAMTALSASNMHNENDYQLLMQALQRSGMVSETSVVNSGNSSLRVETMSLYALALARAKKPDLTQMALLVSKILSEKTYYGYGSTQATVLALNAVVTYQLLNGEKAMASEMTMQLNQQSVTSASSLVPLLREGNNTFTVKYNNEQQAVPFHLEVSYYTFMPPNSAEAALMINTQLADSVTRVGETLRMNITVRNSKNSLQPMAIAKIGIPAGLTVQPWQLKQLVETKQVAYYEIFDNYLVLYWMGLAPTETKKIALDLKAEIPGRYTGRASNVYLYYTPEYKQWSEGVTVVISE